MRAAVEGFFCGATGAGEEVKGWVMNKENHEMKTSYGLDLAGFSAGKSALAKATFDETQGFQVVVYRTHPFSKELEGRDHIGPQLDEERELIQILSPLYIDVPIDLQGLPVPKHFTFTWELTKRPIDFAFGALPPLADRIGTPVARMKNILRDINFDILGVNIFETYPKASLANILDEMPSYKAQTAEFSQGVWIGEGGLADILRMMNAIAEEGTVLNDDHVDAMICSLTGVVPPDHLLQGELLETEVRRRLNKKVRAVDRPHLITTLPKGYVVISKLPHTPLHVTLADEMYS
ncbi:MAG: hypothetical protein KDA68_10260 [Planctomycetaceae bacterium]|nr:hypothetical protein [Planctomycetaceae bacterium]